MMKVLILGLLLVSFIVTQEEGEQGEDWWWWRKYKKPNVILIIADDLGYNDVGWQGNSGMITPTLDSLAANGVIINDQYVSPWCTPTRAAIMTGRYPIRLGLQHLVATPSREMGLPLDEKILPEYLKEEGYATHLVGKWHLGMYDPAYLPTSRGFDTFYGTYFNVEHISHEKSVPNDDSDCPADIDDVDAFPQVNSSSPKAFCSKLFTSLFKCGDDVLNFTTSCRSMLQDFRASNCFQSLVMDLEMDDDFRPAPKKVDDTDELPAYTGLNWQQDTPTSFERSTKRDGMFSSQDIAEEALGILDAHDTDDPMFMTLAFTAVHTPIEVDVNNSISECYDGRFPLSNRQVLCTMVSGMDNAVSQVVDKLIEKDMYENSVIIFLSDNGGVPFQSSNAPFRGQKSTLLQGGVRVASFIHAPRRLDKTAGTSKSGYIHAVDWFTTIRRLAGSRDSKWPQWLHHHHKPTPGKKVDGMNMWKFLSKPSVSSPRNEILLNIDPVCAVIATSPYVETIGPHAAYIYDNWKYFEGDPGSELIGDCFLGDGSSLPNAPATYYCPFSLNADGVALIDLEADPLETTNVADDNLDVVEFMKARVESFRAEMVPAQWPSPSEESNPTNYDGWWTPWVNNPDLSD